MKTNNDNTKKYAEYFKQQAILSATSLFNSISNAINSNPDLQEVILLKQTPRYDPSSNDPHSVKAALSQLYNDTIVQLWLSSPLKSKISIGSHSLECSGGIRDSRYRKGKLFEGIHMYGPSGRKAYTESVLKIIRNAGHVLSSPPVYFHNYHKTEIQSGSPPQENYTCPTQDSDWQNDKDIRYKRNINSTFQYSVPTFKRFTNLNQQNC